MTNKEAIGILRELNERRKVVHAEDVGPLKVRSDRITQSIDMAIAALEKQEGKKAVWIEEVYERHDWQRCKNGAIDDLAMEIGYHNGPFCKRCYYSFCVHCVQDVEAELNKPCDCSHYECPACRNHVSKNTKICPKCGQRIDWSDENGAD